MLGSISSVSGGSLAASYFLTHPPVCDESATQEAQQTCWHEYFSEFKEKMRVNYQNGILIRNSRPTRFSSPTRRFVFSNVCLAAGAIDPSGGANANDGKHYRIMAEKALADRAFSLEEVLLRRLADGGPPPENALILSVDSGVHLDPEDLKRLKNFKMNATPAHVNLVVHSPRVRGQAYHDIFWEELSAELAKAGIDYEKITFRHSEAELVELPSSCVGKLSGLQAISDLLLEIPTLFKIDECNADLLELAAHQLVHETFNDEAVQRLGNEGLSIHTAHNCAMAL